jgi:large subunit ribosomal protein L9
MEVILLERVAKLGQMGEVVTSRTATPATSCCRRKRRCALNDANIKAFEDQKAQLEARNLETKAEAEKLAAELDGQQFVVIRSASDAGALYGSVTTRDAADAATEDGFSLDRKQVALSRPIKELGLHTVHVNLHPEVEVDIVLNVARSPEEAELAGLGQVDPGTGRRGRGRREFEIAELFDDIGAARDQHTGPARCRRTPDRPDVQPAFAEQTEAPERVSSFVADPALIADGLEHPWAVAVLPDLAGYLVTERPGRLRHVSRDGVVSDPIAGVPDVFAVSQGGLLDVALAPDFAESRVIYLSFAKPLRLMRSTTAVVRARLSEDRRRLTDVVEIFEQSPPSRVPIHFGSRVVPAPDGTVWITTGERGGTPGLRSVRRTCRPPTAPWCASRRTARRPPGGPSPISGARRPNG